LATKKPIKVKTRETEREAKRDPRLAVTLPRYKSRVY